ncbi:MAG TPA: phosphoribosylamine--glycine ligase [Jiangellaceae bacterium]|nr:phosphoribosylamine--glycine ligase [Jiangellaceae bacterium]
MRVLIIGSGGREHALLRSLLDDPSVDDVHAAPGNAGMADEATTHQVDVTDAEAVADLATRLAADLVVVGPEVALVAGAADAVRKRGIACFGPSARAAMLEGSKAVAKDVMAAAGVPTAMSVVAETPAEIDDALDRFGAPFVVKHDGLAGGKGVVVTSDRDVAAAHAARCGRVVIEEYLDGPEISLFCLCDGESVIPLMPAQDFKRVYDGDNGPNTGGMGAYAPLDWAPDGLADDVVARIVQPTMDELKARGTPFTGLFYVGLALTSRGLRVIELNVRFGDPETQAVLWLLRSGLGSLLHAAATGRLRDHPEPLWRPGAAVTVVVAAAGYPDSPRAGDQVAGVAEAEALDEPGTVQVLHAGTRRSSEGSVVSSGGRVLSVTGWGEDLATARARVYRAVEATRLDGGHYRSDIAAAAQRGDIVVPLPGSPTVLP